MTPQPSPALVVRARTALEQVTDPTQELAAVAEAVRVPVPAARFWIALIRDRDQARRDAQYIP